MGEALVNSDTDNSSDSPQIVVPVGLDDSTEDFPSDSLDTEP